MKFNLIGAFAFILLLLTIGEIVSKKTKALIPSVFVSAVLFLLGFWTFLPANLMDIASVSSPVVTLAMSLLIVHLGTLMSGKELLAQWRSIVIGLSGTAGVCLFTLTIGAAVFGWQTVVAATAPLSGGVVAALMMSQAATNKGLTQIGILVISIYIMHGFVGYPVTAYCLKKEAKRVINGFRGLSKDAYSGKSEVAATKQNAVRKKLIPSMPSEYQSTYFILLKLSALALLAAGAEALTHGAVSRYIFCLIFGVIGCELGIVEPKALDKANSFGWLMTILMAFIFSSLVKATPQMLIKIIVPLVAIIAIGVIGLALTSILVGRALGYSKEMALSVALTALFGFPADYILTHEAIKSVSSNPQEYEYALGNMLPKMLVGGFTTVTVASVVIAGIFVKLL